MIEWHRLEVADALAQLKTDPERGLSQAEVQYRLAEHGPNELTERGLASPYTQRRFGFYSGLPGGKSDGRFEAIGRTQLDPGNTKCCVVSK